MHRISHDFNKLEAGKEPGMHSAPLVCAGTRRDLEELHLTLEDGMEVLLYEPDGVGPDGAPDCLEVRAKIRYDAEAQCFMGDFNFKELMYRSETERNKR